MVGRRRMRVIRQFALMVAVVLPLITPAMACVLPSAQLTSAERACCRKMALQCGNMEMPASHGCCSKVVPTVNQWSAAQLAPNLASAVANATPDLPSVNPFQLPSGLTPEESRRITLPQSPPIVPSILRI